MPFMKRLVSTETVAASVGSETSFNLLLTESVLANIGHEHRKEIQIRPTFQV